MQNNSHVLLKLELNQLQYDIFKIFLKIIHLFFFKFEALYKAAHAAIRADPSPSKKKETKADAPKPKR